MRTVKVQLEADVAGFKTGVDSAKRSVDDLDDKVEALDKDLDKIPADALKAAAAVKALGDGVKGAADHLDTMAAKSAGLSVLDQKLAESRAEVKKLTEEFVKTGDMDVFERLGRASSNNRSLTDIRKKLAKTLEEGALEGGKAAAGTFSSMLQSGIAESFKSLPPEIKAGIMVVLGAAAVAAIPVIVAAIDAALLLGLGAGGLAGGIALAVQDPNVLKVYGDLGQHIMTTLTRAVTPFRSELVGAAMMFGESFDKITPNINRMANTLSKAIYPIAHGLGGLFENAAPGIEKAFQGALPLLREFGEWLPKLGDEIGEMGDALANAEPEAELFFKFLLANVDLAIHSITWLSNGIHNVAGIMMRWVGQYQPISPALADDTSALNDLSDAATSTGDSFANMLAVMGKVPATADDVVVALKDKVLTNMMALDQATLGFQESLTKLSESLKKNGDTLDFHTKKGQSNAEAMLAAVQANIKLFDANVAGGMSAAAAAAQYDTNAAAIEAAGRKAGLTKQEINDLIGKYREVPKKIDTDIAAHGLKNAITDLQETIILANNLNGKAIHINAYLHQHYTQGFDDAGLGHQGAKHRGDIVRHAASGLIVPPSSPGTVMMAEAETGGEAYIPLRGISQMRAMSLAQQVGNGYGFDAVPRGGGSGTLQLEHTLRVVDGSNGRSGLATLVANMARTGELQITSRAIV